MTKEKLFKNSMKEMVQEILKIISKEEIEQIAREVGFVKIDIEIKALNSFICVHFLN